MKRKLSFLALAAAFSLPCKAQESSVAVEVENVKQSKVAIMASAMRGERQKYRVVLRII